MPKRIFRDYGIRPRGSYEIAVDPLILIQASSKNGNGKLNHARRLRSSEVYGFIVKLALRILPPEQRKIFYSVWVRSGGRMNRGVMEYSRRISKSHFTSYNNYYKAIASIQTYLKRTGYGEHVLQYLHGEEEKKPASEWRATEDDLL